LPGTAFDSWINVAVPRLRNQRAANKGGTDVNPPIPSTTSGSNSLQATAQLRVAFAKRKQKGINRDNPAKPTAGTACAAICPERSEQFVNAANAV
jgi:hypothetical protein